MLKHSRKLILGGILAISLIFSYIFYDANIEPEITEPEKYTDLDPEEAEEVMKILDENERDIFWGYRIDEFMHSIDENEQIELSQRNIYDIMHQMANTLIIADDIWGYIRITPDRIDYLEDYIAQSDFDDKNIMLGILERWKDGDFSKGVSEHDYFWRKLDGTIGKAISLREKFYR